MPKQLLIDGDMVAHRCARSCEPTKTKPYLESLEEGIFRANDLLYRIVNTCAAEEFRVFISGGRNFRKLIDPNYKANRDGLPYPAHLDAIRELLVREWNAELCDGFEADDGIGMAHSEQTIIVSNDKDFRQLGGEIFNPIKNGGEFEEVDSYEATLSFYSQMLEGDATDNVRGVDGLGKVKARRALVGLPASEMHNRVFELYGGTERFLRNFRLLRILRSEEEWREIEAELMQGQGEEPTEACSEVDLGDLSGVNKE